MAQKPTKPHRSDLLGALTAACALAGASCSTSAAAATAAALAQHALQFSAVSQAALMATNRIVSSCADDGGAGTLRNVVAGAGPGDSIDLTGLPAADPTCVTSTITLATALLPSVPLTLKGPPGHVLTLAGGGSDRVIGSTQPFEIDDLSISHGRRSDRGGCLSTTAGVVLHHSNVSDCIVTSPSKYALGGAIDGNTVSLLDGSRVEASQALATKTQGSIFAVGLGGGVFAGSQLTCVGSTISGNTASLIGGGAFSYGSMDLTRCTIDGNPGGGLGVAPKSGGPQLGTLTISESTISGNGGAGIFAQASVTLTASTVAFNTSANSNAGGIYATGTVNAQSSIIASNSAQAGSTHYDLQIGGAHVLNGADNLVVSTDVTAGAGVITVTADPQLQPLASNGGPTRTHALGAASPAIDKGNNAPLLPTDQRGPGFAREVPTGSPDIGAYEFRGDGIFIDGFE